MAKGPKKTKLTNDDDVFKGKGADDIVLAKGGDDSVSGGGGNDKLNGGAGNDVLKGGGGDDTLNGGEGNDILLGGTGDDRLAGGTGDNTIDGGEGDDTVVLTGNFADAVVTKDGDGYKIVTADGTTTIKNVELVQFADGTKTIDEIEGEDSGDTFTLTTALDNVTGTSGNDLIAGNVTAAATTSFQTGDIIDGADGDDTLRIATDTAGTVLPSISNVENVEFTNVAALTLNLLNSSGVKNFISNGSTDATKIDNQDAIATIALKSTTTNASDFTLNYAVAAVAGTTDVQSLALTTNGTKVAAGITYSGDVTVNGVETFAVTSTGDNFVGALAGDALKTVTVEGAGMLDVDTLLATTVTTFDASKATGAVSVGFAAGADVTATGGAGDDYFEFGAGLTVKDVVDAGAGTDTVGLTGADFTAVGNAAQLAGINGLKGVEGLYFNGATTINRATLTNTELKTFTFTGAGADVINSALAADIYAFDSGNSGNATFTMKAGETTLNIQLNADILPAFDDAVIGALNTGTAGTVNIASTGASATAGNVNSIGAVTNAANSTFVVTGDANTTITSFAAAVTLNASALTGNLAADLSAGNDTYIGSKGVNTVEGGTGIDSINLTASTGKVDTVNLFDVLTDADRDAITGFTSGAGGDKIQLDAADTDGTGVAGGAPTFQEIGTNVGTATVIAATDVLEFAFDLAGTGLGDGSANSLDGTNLLAAVGTLNVADAGDNGYIVAYQGGNAYLYHFDEADAATTVQADEIELIATLSGVAVGSVVAANFELL